MSRKYLEYEVMETLQKSGLTNVTNSAYALEPDFTPGYNGMVIELGSLTGYQVRVIGTMIALDNIGYMATHEQAQAAAKRALRLLMVKMRNQAERWLEANPEPQGG